MSDEIQAIATNNYLLATPIGSGYMETSALEYDGDKISGYAGSAFKAGDELPSGTMNTSGLEYDNTEISGYSGSAFKDVALTDVVTANSGAWGGSALPISAGKGVKINLVDNTLVFSNDETILFSGANAWGYGTISLSESFKNFERIKVLATRAYSADNNTDKFSGPWCEFDCAGIASTTASWGAVTPAIYEGPYWKYSTYTANATFTQLDWSQGGYIKITNPSDYASATNWIDGKAVGIKAVIGINRVAGGN